MRVGRMIFGAIVGLLLSACGGNGELEQRITAAQQCDGTLSSEASRALETLLGTKKFDAAPLGGVGRGAEQLTGDYAERKRSSLHPPVCRVGGADSTDRIDITFGLYADRELFGDVHPDGLHAYELGREAQSGRQKAYLFVRCVSPQLEGTQKRAARIRGVLDFGGATLPDTPATREANLTVLHSVTLAVVKKLDCENNAGLPEKPVFKPKP
ncbi:hypothetical protein ACGF1Z_11345 [Streptomyces sp. NPDC048018]|uniref:hypothetical protein n=1 Tax=Streptomyces sp. NPDC048018 TaxID=3365499 RepID=UPI003720E275